MGLGEGTRLRRAGATGPHRPAAGPSGGVRGLGGARGLSGARGLGGARGSGGVAGAS